MVHREEKYGSLSIIICFLYQHDKLTLILPEIIET